MLSLQLKSGEYLTIGDDIAVQIFKQSGRVFRVEVKAPREVPILRGAVREKGGADRPDGLLTRQPVTPSRRRHSAQNAEESAKRREFRAALWERRAGELEAMEAVLDRLDAAGDSAAVGEGLRELRSHLETVRSLSGTEIIS